MKFNNSQTSGFPKVCCLIPGCNKSTSQLRPVPEGNFNLDTGTPEIEWICQTHWRPVPKRLKQRRSTALRRHKLLISKLKDDSGKVAWESVSQDAKRRIEKLHSIIRKSWSSCKDSVLIKPEELQHDVETVMGW